MPRGKAVQPYEDQETLCYMMLRVNPDLPDKFFYDLWMPLCGTTLTGTNLVRARERLTGMPEAPIAAKARYFRAMFSKWPTLRDEQARASAKQLFGQDTRGDFIAQEHQAALRNPMPLAEAQATLDDLELRHRPGRPQPTFDLGAAGLVEAPADLETPPDVPAREGRRA